MKRFLSAFLVSVMLLTLPACAASVEASATEVLVAQTLSATADTGFSDVPLNAWYAEAVQYLSGRGIMVGTGDNEFSPDGTFTRAQFATVLYRMAGEPTVTGDDSFTDTESGTWYSNAVLWAEQNHVVEGVGGSLYGTNTPSTQEQLVTMLWRDAGEPATTSAANDASVWAAAAVEWARAEGLTDGTELAFTPKSAASRAQVAVICYRYMNKDNTSPQTEDLPEGVVRMTAGLAQGTQSGGIYAYLGVPYAEATERFVPASAVTPWEGTRSFTSYGKISYQGTVVGIAGSNGSNNDNNCQNLNVWTPGIRDGEKRAVMVWLHGGGFSTGSANESSYNGANLAKNQDVVVVGVNHRLNVFGHLDLSAYDEKYQYSANVGIDDIVKALQWIRDNIEQFGGDPDNVTVFGQSGGGAKVLSLMTTPNAASLFHKGIVMSGATEIMGVSFSTKEISQRIAELTLQNLGISSDNLDALQTVSYSRLFDASDSARAQAGREFGVLASLSTEYGIEWGPVVEGDYMPTNPVTETGFADAGRDIPLLIGSTFSEWTHWRSIVMHSNMTQAQRDAFAAAYPDRPASDAPYVDSFIRLPMLKIMSHKVDQGGAEVYAYVFNYGNDPYHGYDIPYAFGNASGTVSTAMSTAFANFAKTGVPSASGLPTWEPYIREGGATMILNTTSRLAHHHDKELMELLEPNYRW